MKILGKLEEIKSNIAILKNIKSNSDTFNLTLTGLYFDDINIVLKDYINTKNTYLALLQSSGQDNDLIANLTVLNNKLTRENSVLKDRLDKYDEIINRIINYINYYQTKNGSSGV